MALDKAVSREDFPAFGNLMREKGENSRLEAMKAEAEWPLLLLLLLSPNKADVSNEFQVQSNVFSLARTRLKSGEPGSSRCSSGHHQTIPLNIQFTFRRGKKTESVN